MFKKLFIRIILAVVLLSTLFSNINYTAYAETVSEVSFGSFYEETENGFILHYEENRDDKTIYYEEEVKGDIIFTEKFFYDDNNKILLERKTTSIEHKDDGTLIAQIENQTNNSNETKIIGSIDSQPNKSEKNEELNNIMPMNRRRHPLYNDYVFSRSISGHVGFANLTRAAIIGVISTVITGGKLIGGAVASIANAVISGQTSNLYYKDETYTPYGSGAGRPLWRKIVRYYYDQDRTIQSGDTLLYNADVLTQR